eukprot:TRINITY_DN3851_c6_g1_i2.p1 TRINITY_DN3851_c6_g1~~TRINITY_DN3851_c6_g1_i2.p1  ORF type:complete len:238 (+),score=34.05 TRINITY_DN3851_c6_g1_i2:43-756(+)
MDDTKTEIRRQFNATEGVCEKFGFQPGSVLRYGAGALKGKKTEVVGVLDGKLWSVDEGSSVATFFNGSNKEEIVSIYGVETLENLAKKAEAEDQARLEDTREVQAMLVHTKRIETLDSSPHVCAKFGFKSGDCLTYTKGALTGKQTTIIGVFEGKLWSRDDGESGVSFLCGSNHAEIQGNYGLVPPRDAPILASMPSEKIAIKIACVKRVEAMRQNLRVHYGMSAAQAVKMVPDVAL